MISYYSKHVLTLALIFLHGIVTQINIANKSVVPLERYTVGLQLSIEVLNEFSLQSCKIMSWCDRCCLSDIEGEECDGPLAYGGDMGILKPKERRTLVYVYPTRYPHDLLGYCDVNVYYGCDMTYAGRKLVKLPFDTRIFMKSWKRAKRDLFKRYLPSNLKVMRCRSEDLNPLDKCSPVVCDWKYGGHRPFYDLVRKRCVEAPACIGTVTKDLPDVAYVPQANICRDLKQPLLVEDIDAISLGLGVVSQSSNCSDCLPSKNYIRALYETVSRHLKYLRENIFENPYGKSTTRSLNNNYSVNDDHLSDDKCPEHDNNCSITELIITIFYHVALILLILFIVICFINFCFWAGCRCSLEPVVVKSPGRFKKCLKKKLRRNRKREEVKNTVIREVMMRDVPLGLRDNLVTNKDKNKRYKHAIIKKFGLNRMEKGQSNIESSSITSVDCDASDYEHLLH